MGESLPAAEFDVLMHGQQGCPQMKNEDRQQSHQEQHRAGNKKGIEEPASPPDPDGDVEPQEQKQRDRGMEKPVSFQMLVCERAEAP